MADVFNRFAFPWHHKFKTCGNHSSTQFCFSLISFLEYFPKFVSLIFLLIFSSYLVSLFFAFFPNPRFWSFHVSVVHICMHMYMYICVLARARLYFLDMIWFMDLNLMFCFFFSGFNRKSPSWHPRVASWRCRRRWGVKASMSRLSNRRRRIRWNSCAAMAEKSCPGLPMANSNTSEARLASSPSVATSLSPVTILYYISLGVGSILIFNHIFCAICIYNCCQMLQH